MIKKEDIVAIGKFQKTHALKGELNALLDIDGDYAADGHPLIVDIDGIYVPFYAETVRPKGAESFLVKLRDIDSQEKAQELVNKEIFGLRSDLVEYFDDPDMEIVADFVGYKVVDSRLGEIGSIEDVDDSTANVLFVVVTDDGETVYIPVAEEFINAVDDERKVVETTLPEGLVDLNV
ncbi:MAG: ribosome maturation factor RimM [Muribaculaceae bacterium]|nr:ribosome maturation factor RimM [Muribaculaceae bacterium]